MKRSLTLGIFLMWQLLLPVVVQGQVGTEVEAQNTQELEAIDDQVQNLKSEVIQINHELSLLEEKLLFPSTTQVAMFVSLQSDIELDSINAKLNNVVVSNHVYSFRELEALQKGGVQRLYTGNVPSGNHQISIEIQGRASGTSVKQVANYTFKKEIGPKFVEIQLTGSARAPSIKFKDW